MEKRFENLAFATASAIHEEWRLNEIKNFYKRFMVELEKAKETEEEIAYDIALNNACYKNGKKRNEASRTIAISNTILEREKLFVEEASKGVNLVIARYVQRELTEREKRICEYEHGLGENINVPFERLSQSSKNENLLASESAVAIYIELAKRGMTLEDMEKPENLEKIGKLIHIDWMKRNKPTNNNSYLYVRYDELDDYAKSQDLAIFKVVLGKIKENENLYTVEKGKKLPQINVASEEDAAIKKWGLSQNN